MQVIRRKLQSFDDLLFTINLTDYDKTISDIEDVFFSVKKELTDDDTTIFSKTQGDGEIVVTGEDVSVNCAVPWDYNEYDNFTVGENYQAGLFVKFTGDPVADEHVDQTFVLLIEQDFLRE